MTENPFPMSPPGDRAHVHFPKVDLVHSTIQQASGAVMLAESACITGAETIPPPEMLLGHQQKAAWERIIRKIWPRFPFAWR